jgi:DNA-binding winged helix-turn-helix (wHTH) protein/tetratricopeptide (TPR) repeat protein
MDKRSVNRDLDVSTRERPVYEFGPFRIDPAERQVLREGVPVPLTAKAFDTLLLLVQRSNHLVEKSEMMSTIWPNSYVEESNLSVTIWMLRKALGGNSDECKFIQTVAKRGYRFVADVRETLPSIRNSMEEGTGKSVELVPNGLTLAQEYPSPCEPFPSAKVEPPHTHGFRLFWVTSAVRITILALAMLVTAFAVFHYWPTSYGATRIYSLPFLTKAAAGVRSTPVREESRNRQAYQLYLEGRYFWNKRTEDGLRRSIEYFQQATLEDDRYAEAYAGLADSYALLGSYGVEPAERAYPNAKAAALKALQLDSSLAEAHSSLGMIAFYYGWNWEEAGQEFRRSLDINPDYAMTHTWYAVNLVAIGRKDEAIDQVRKAEELDPMSLIINTEVGRVFYLTRQYDRAIAAYRKVIDLDPGFARAHTRLGMVYAAKRDFVSAIQEFEKAKALSGTDPYLDGLIGYAQASLGNTALAEVLLKGLIERSHREYVPSFSIALICIGLGNRDQAMDLLTKSYQDRSTYMVYAKVDPLLDSIRSDPRFSILLRRMNLY